MAALKLDMTIPLGNAGHAHLIIDIPDTGALTEDDRAFLADTCDGFCAYAARVIAPPGTPDTPAKPPPAVIHDPNASVLNGVTGSRIRDKL